MITAHDNRSVEDLLEDKKAGQKVADLLEQPGWPVLLGAVRGRRDELLYPLIHGNPQNEAVLYADKVAEIRGLEQMLDLAKTVIAEGEIAGELIDHKEAGA